MGIESLQDKHELGGFFRKNPEKRILLVDENRYIHTLTYESEDQQIYFLDRGEERYTGEESERAVQKFLESEDPYKVIDGSDEKQERIDMVEERYDIEEWSDNL